MQHKYFKLKKYVFLDTYFSSLYIDLYNELTVLVNLGHVFQNHWLVGYW